MRIVMIYELLKHVYIQIPTELLFGNRPYEPWTKMFFEFFGFCKNVMLHEVHHQLLYYLTKLIVLQSC